MATLLGSRGKCAHNSFQLFEFVPLRLRVLGISCRVGEVTFEKELSYNYSYFWVRNLGTSVTSVKVTTERDLAEEVTEFQIQFQNPE